MKEKVETLKVKIENPAVAQLMEAVDAKFNELDFADNAVGRAERKK